jgi:hypothetical protein
MRDHPKTSGVARSNDLLALWTRLGMLFVERWGGKRGDEIIIHDRELAYLTGKGRADVARKLLRCLADVSPISAEPNGEVWLITWPNFAKKQGFEKRTRKELDTSESDSESDTDLKKQEGLVRVWNEGIEEIESVLRRPVRFELTPKRRASLRALAAEHRQLESPFRDVVRGYVAFHQRPGGGFDPAKYLKPDTLLAAANRQKYLEALWNSELPMPEPAPPAPIAPEARERMRSRVRTVHFGE